MGESQEAEEIRIFVSTNGSSVGWGGLIVAKKQKVRQQPTAVKAEQLELPLEQQITQSQLENHLWESANILRDPVDAVDFKNYIFPLLFFKRICAIYDEKFYPTPYVQALS